MKKRKTKQSGIQKKLLLIGLLPILLLGVMIVTIGMVVLYRSYTGSIEEELVATTSVLIDCLDLTVRGDYSYRDDMLMKGNLNITDSTMLYRIKESSQIDTTIFWKDIRILTTVENKYGVSAVGTRAAPEVARIVMDEGTPYFSREVNVNGTPYIGYYIPLQNSDHTVVGMIFAGKRRQLVIQKVWSMILWYLIFAAIALVTAVLLIRIFSRRMVVDINGINGFLKTISEGDLTAELDESIVERSDELGTIGQYAVQMRSDLKMLIERDPLTSLFNRRSCNNRLNALKSEKAVYSVVMCDIDFFKKVNDTYGHDAGDYVLVTISTLIRDNVRDCGFASRWGGEEFLLVYRLDESGTRAKVEQLQKQIREYDYRYEGTALKITMTFGIASEEGSDSYEERIRRADDKLYTGKQNGRDQIVC